MNFDNTEGQGRRYDWRGEERGGDGGKQEANKQQTKKNKICQLIPSIANLYTVLNTFCHNGIYLVF